MNQKNSIRLIIGLALGAVGIVLFLSHNPKDLSVAAGNPINYSTNWQATKLITMCCWGSNKYVALGVSEWKVNGTVGSKTYTETWKVPAFNNAKFTTTGGGKFTGIDINKWMTGAVRTWRSDDLTFTERDVATVIAESSSTNKTEHTSQAGGTGGVQCSGRDTDCRHVSGAYGWTDGESLGGARSSSQPHGGGIFMPLEWNVTGIINE